jgi:Domain of unknown function (DUF4258)
MGYELTEHARDALEKRHIAVAWVERAFDAPEATETDPVDPDLEHRLARIPKSRRGQVFKFDYLVHLEYRYQPWHDPYESSMTARFTTSHLAEMIANPFLKKIATANCF